MSRENVEIVRRGYESLIQALERGEFEEGTLDWLDPEIEWRGPREFPDLAEPRHGHDGVREYAAVLFEAIEDYHITPEEFIDVGDQVLVFSREGGTGARQRGRGPKSADGPSLDAPRWQGRSPSELLGAGRRPRSRRAAGVSDSHLELGDLSSVAPPRLAVPPPFGGLRRERDSGIRPSPPLRRGPTSPGY
jgi:ketosteroid isomerase-like protein